MSFAVKNRALRFAVKNTDYGVLCGAHRPASPGSNYWRIGQFMFPFFTQVPTGVLGTLIRTAAWVPMDDYHVINFTMFGAFDKPTSDETVARGLTNAAEYEFLKQRMIYEQAAVPNTSDWFGRFRNKFNVDNDYLLDRDDQRRATYTGLPTFVAEDQAVTESMGPIVDRSKEHLGRGDVVIVRTRRRMLEAVEARTQHGISPPGVDDPSVYRVRSGGIILPDGAEWLAAVADWGSAYDLHPEADMLPEPIYRHSPTVLESAAALVAAEDTPGH